ncbi:MAG: hypothetical protein AB7P22_17120 [Vicinamibacterales bacterium]
MYLAAAREHPPAAALRQQERDYARIGPIVRDFTATQGELFLLLGSVVNNFQPADLHQLLDEDVADAAGALASTLETAARGVIYEHRPASRPAERLVAAFKELLAQAGKAGGGTRLDREAILVLKRLEESARPQKDDPQSSPRAFIELLGRVIRMPPPDGKTGEAAPPEGSGLIVP